MIRESIDRIAAALREGGGIENPAIEARWILSALLQLSYNELALRAEQPLEPEAAARLPEILRRRLAGEPLQYIFGSAPFRELELEVTPAVLIPRPETELLVDRVLGRLPAAGRCLDLGCGSGAIALSVAFEMPGAGVTAVDVSPAALEVARRNAAKYHLENRVKFLCGDLYAPLAPEERFNVIAANLPYVTEEEYPALPREVRAFEPELALVAPKQGLALIERAVAGLKERLAPGGYAIFELSPPQAPRVAAMVREAGLRPEILRDWTGRDRFVTATGSGL